MKNRSFMTKFNSKYRELIGKNLHSIPQKRNIRELLCSVYG